MARRTYGQFCGLARALEVVGERWALLVVRDLTVGPRRFTDLRRGLPRIPSNVLAARLKELEHAGVVRRRVLPRPAASVVYELTDHGRDLEDVIYRLARWGARSLGEPRPDEIITVDSLIVALRTTFRADAARGLRASYQLRVGDVVVHARIAGDILDVAEGTIADPDLVIETDTAFKALLADEVNPVDAVADGSVRLTGDHGLLIRFIDVFHLPAPLAA